MLQNIFILITSIFIIIKSATMASKYASKLAESFNLSKYTIGFIVIAIISILPETFISINAAVQNVPAFGLATLFGSNISDLTLIFAILVAYSGHGIRIQSKILKNNVVYPIFLLVPIILGFDGNYTRLEGLTLIIIGAAFYYLAFKDGNHKSAIVDNPQNKSENTILFLLSMLVLLISSHFTVTSATALAYNLNISPILIGILIVGLGTTMPELLFSLKSVKKNDESLAIGDILGTVLADATIVVGLIAIINPFSFPQKIIYSTGIFMVVSSFLLFYFLNSQKYLSKKESFILFIFWLTYISIEIVLGI